MKYLALLLLLAATTAQAQVFRKNVYILPESVSTREALLAVYNTRQKFKAQGISIHFKVYEVRNYGYPTVSYQQQVSLLRKLGKDFKARNTHFIVKPFEGNLFSGVAYVRGKANSLATMKPARLVDNTHLLLHELAHTFGARHDFSNCNLMGYYRTCSNPMFNQKALREMR